MMMPEVGRDAPKTPKNLRDPAELLAADGRCYPSYEDVVPAGSWSKASSPEIDVFGNLGKYTPVDDAVFHEVKKVLCLALNDWKLRLKPYTMEKLRAHREQLGGRSSLLDGFSLFASQEEQQRRVLQRRSFDRELDFEYHSSHREMEMLVEGMWGDFFSLPLDADLVHQCVMYFIQYMDKRDLRSTTWVFASIQELLCFALWRQKADTAQVMRFDPDASLEYVTCRHFTLLTRSFESKVWSLRHNSASVRGGKWGTPPVSEEARQDCRQVYALYRQTKHKNSHSTAAMVKAFGFVRNLKQVVIFLSEYRKLKKHAKNEKYAFVIYQAALDSAARHQDLASERYVREAIWQDQIWGVDEFWNRALKVDPNRAPRTTHPHLY